MFAKSKQALAFISDRTISAIDVGRVDVDSGQATRGPC